MGNEFYEYVCLEMSKIIERIFCFFIYIIKIVKEVYFIKKLSLVFSSWGLGLFFFFMVY